MLDFWFPISTAPKSKPDEDDIWILACRQGSKIPMVTTWDHEENKWYTFNLALEGWQNSRYGIRKPWEPTHWRPLPAPPK